MAQSTNNMPDQSAISAAVLGQKLKAERLRQKRSQEDVAEAAGLGQSRLSKIERSTAISVKTKGILKVVEALGFSDFEAFIRDGKAG